MTDSDEVVTLDVHGLDCADCASTVRGGVAQIPGVRSCDLSFATGQLRVTGRVERSQVIDRVRELGYEAREAPASEERPATGSPLGFLPFMWRRRDTRLALIGALLVAPGVVSELAGMRFALTDAASLIALAAAGTPIAKRAWRALLINRQLNIDVLMTIASLGAVGIGAYSEAGLVMVLYSIGTAMEGYTASKARDAIRSLRSVVPSTAIRLRQDGDGSVEEEVDVESLSIGDRVLVRPGERIPVDGRVVSGVSAVDQAPLTGESLPVDKAKGATVFASSMNGHGALEIQVARPAQDSFVSRMVELVAEAHERRAPVERFVDRFARVYTPAIVGLALLVAVLPPILLGWPLLSPPGGGHGWLYRGLALLVVACPCALVISTPVSVISAITNAARNGCLIKGGTVLEQFSRVRAIAIDKTGTLTEGRPEVLAVRAAGCVARADPAGEAELCPSCEDVLALAGAVERRSEHPLAKAIVAEVKSRGLARRYPAAEGVVARVGRGVTGRVGDRQMTVGSHGLFDDEIAHSAVQCRLVDELSAQGQTVVMVAVDGEFLGTISVADRVRPSSRVAVSELRRSGIETIVMLTGDNRETAVAVAGEIGLTDVRSGLMPQEKAGAVNELQEEYGAVAMVGDGINDALALVTADVGVAVGAAGGATTQAMETADIALMRDDLLGLPFAYRLSRATMLTIRANVLASIAIKLLFVVLVLAGLGTMWMAVLADVGTSLLVTLHGMRLLKWPSARPGMPHAQRG